MTISVMLADDQALVRGGLRLILEDQPDITVTGEAIDGAEAIALARRLRPDVCLIDIRMPKFDGIEVTRVLAGAEVTDPLRVVIVTTFHLDEYVYGALHSGAVGFVLKDAGPALLVEAVRAANAGDALISPSITLRLLRQFAPQTHLQGGEAPPTPDRTRIRSDPRGRTGPHQPGDRRATLRLAQHRQELRRRHPEQA